MLLMRKAPKTHELQQKKHTCESYASFNSLLCPTIFIWLKS